MRILKCLWFITISAACTNVGAQPTGQIDRRALVERHTSHYDQYAPELPASVGNGEFAFMLGITGLLAAPSIPSDRTGVPDDAVVIFDGSTTDNLVMNDGSPCTWPIDDGTLLVPGNQRENRGVWTKYHFRDAEIHVEFMLPKGRGNHGNSGLYFYGMVELQIYNSHDHPGDPKLAMGSVYGIAPPLAGAGLPPEQWQTYDIKFVAPRRNDAGDVVTPGTITARLNGKLVQDKTPFTKPLSTYAPMTYRVPPYVRDMIAKLERTEAGPLYLQDHDAPVRFRNIWIRPLDDRAGVWERDE